MSKKWIIRATAIIMAAVLALSAIYAAAGGMSAQAAVTQSQIDELKKAQKEHEKKGRELQAQINSFQYQQSTALEKKKVLDEQIELTQKLIDNITEQIAKYDELILQKTADLEAAQAIEDAHMLKYKSHMRAVEENGAISYISVIFKANSLSDLLSRINDMSQIVQYEEELYEHLEAAKKTTLNAKNALETARAARDEDKAELEKSNQNLQTQLEEANELLGKIEDDITAAKDLYEQEKKDADEVQAEINEKTALLKKQQQHSVAVKGTGTLIWPTPSSAAVTSIFGMRYHPNYLQYRMHTGVDIGASYGANIDAADDGTVIISAYSSSYGNYVVIDHGNGTTTLYAHMSKRNVKEDDTVKQGQVIGYVGSTGNSTGPHLHFEVFVDGTRKDPLKYFDPSTYVISQ